MAKRIKTEESILPTTKDKKLIGALVESELLYEGIKLRGLVLYTISAMKEVGIMLSIENIIVSCFSIFPKKFSLFGWPEFPDTFRVHNACRQLANREKGRKDSAITGTKAQFIILPRGEQELKQIYELLNAPQKQKTFTRNRIQEKILAQTKKSKAFISYQNKVEIAKVDMYDVLQCPLGTANEDLRDNYDTLMNYAIDDNNEEVINFLKEIRNQFKEIDDVKRERKCK